jgi:hypothetical protein
VAFLRPALYLSVVDFSIPDFKDSARKFLDRSDAVVMVESDVSRPQWPGISESMLTRKRIFPVQRPGFFSNELRDYVAERISAQSYGGGIRLI